MAGAPWTRAPTGFLSCLYSCLLCTVLLGNVETTVSTSTISGQTTTDSQTTSTPRKTPITSTSTFSNTTLTTATSTSNSKHSTVTTEDTSSSKTGSPPPVTSVVSSTAISSTTCTQEISAVSQNPQTQGGEKTRGSPTSTHVEVTTSSPPTSQGGNTLTQTVSRATSHPGETATTSVSIVSKTPPRTAGVVTMPTSAHSTLATTENTSSPNIGSPPPVTSGVSTTTTSSTTSTQETSAVSQNPQTQGRETTRESPTSTHPVVTSSATQSSPGGHTLTQTVSQVTSTAGETATTSPSKFSQMPSTTSEVLTTPTSTYSTVETTEETSSPKTGSPPPVTSGVSTTATSSTTSTQETSAVSQNPQTQGGETTRESPTSTHVQVTTSAPPSSPGGHTLTQTASQKTTPPCETVTSHSSFSQTPSTTSEVLTKPTSIYSTVERTEETSTLKTGSPPPVTSVVSSTATSSTTSTQETSAVSQNPQTLSLETTRGSPTSTHVEVTTSSPPTSQGGNTLTQTVSRATSHPGETASTAPSSFSKTPSTTSEVLKTPTSSYSTVETTEETSTSKTGSPPPVTSAAAATTSTTSTQETSTVSQNPQTLSLETTRGSPTSTHPDVTTSSPPSSPGGNTLTETVSKQTSPPSETATTSVSIVSKTPPRTAGVVTMPTSAHSTLATAEDTSSPRTGSPPPVTSGVSTTATSSTTSTQETSAVSQNPQTQGRETTRESPTSTHPVVTSSATQSSPGRHTLTQTVSQVTSTPGETATTSPSKFSQMPSTSEVLTTPTSTYSTVETTEETSSPKTGSPPPVTSGVSTTATSSTTSTQETSAVSQNPQTQGGETTRGSPTSTHVEVTTSTPPSSPGGNTLTETVSQVTSPPGETATSPSSVSQTSTTSEVLKTPTSSYSTVETTEETSTPKTGSPPPVTSVVSTTTTSSTTSTQETLTVSQNPQTEGRETTRESPTSTHPDVTTSSPPSAPGRNTLTETVSKQTSPPSETATTSVSIVSKTPPRTAGVVTTSTSAHSTLATAEDTSSSNTGSPPLVTSAVSTTAATKEKSASTSLTTSTLDAIGTLPSATSPPGMIPTSLWINGGRSTALSPPSTTSLTPTNSTPTTSTGFRSTTPSVPVQQGQGVSLFPYGSSVGDTPFVRRTVDFTSQLFKPRIGFPLGSFLRDSLYFTDNGQIIFPESDSQIFSYPNPPRRGFTAWDPVAVVAPFWDDADFSIRRGTIFYQEYETFYNEHNPLVWQVESWIRRFTNSWSYKAKWTLKVTWANAPAYPAQWTFGTCTYQAILSTDGSTSYALFLYQSNGMQWDVAQRPGNSVLMGFSSADGYFANSPLISRPVWERYRPDRWLNSKLGLRGLQIYRLHREAIPNYYLKCQQWLQSQPQWPSWNWNQISCPCTWQQGRWDLRFRPVGSGWWGHGGGRKLCRFSSWQGGVCCSYGPWGELREGWGVDSPWHFEQELEAQNWCCRWNDKPSFCSLYKRRRPPVSCAGYRPSRPGWMFGDPHITTLDGANFTFNGLGDFLLVRAWDGNSSFLLQGRTAQTGSAQATNFIAFAAQYESSSLAPITVQWFLEPNDTIRVLHNNQTVTFETDLEDAEGQEIFNTTGVLLTRNGSQVSASFDGTVAISVMAVSHLLHASSSLPEEYQGRTEGLLGLWNNNPDDDFRMPNGTSVARGSSEEQLFHYGMTWKLNGTGLLGQRDDQLPPTFTPVFFSQLLDNSSGDPALVSGCSGDRQCIYDALAMRDAGAGIHTRTLFRTYRQMNATQNQFPPSIKGEHVICAYKGKSVWIPYTSDSENVVFTLRNNCTDIKLFENGTLLWTPKSLEPFTLEILVRSTKTGLSSAFQPQTVLCACSAESQCLYNQTSWVGNSSLQVADCKCDGDTFGRFCERSKDPCEEECFPGVSCVPERGCEACPIDMTGDGRHCAALENSDLCQNHSCPVNYCHNQGHCYIAPTLSCQPSCTCPPAFTDARCFLAGNSFTPTTHQELPLRTIQLLLIEDENASVAEVNASVAYRLGTLDVRAFLWNSLVEPIASPAPGSGSLIQRWKVTSHFQYRPQGPVIDFLNNRLQEAVVQAFFLQAQRRRWKRSEGPRNNVLFYPISRVDVHDLAALNVSTLETYLKCNGYEGYHLVYGPQSGFTCTSPCTEGYCDHGGQCQHLPDGPRCSCVPFSIYSPWGERCEHLGVKVGAFLGILFGALGALLLLAIATFVLLRLCACGRVKSSYPLGLVG
nr:mucin-4 isoform X10 [Oryctolagus cuniculus]